MLLENSAGNNCCWKDISSAAISKDVLRVVIDYLDNRQGLPGFPFVVFSDHIPDSSDILSLFTADQLSGCIRRPFIIALHPPETAQQPACWSLLDQGITDITGWQQADELIRYLESKYRRNKEIADLLDSPLVRQNLVGESSAWKRFLSDVIESTLFSQASILLIGESGTGKEMISRLIHTVDRRPEKKKLIIVDCTTLSPELSGSELFGHERGSYTSAVQSREGAIALANGGTLFLDEVGELSLPLQAELLRVLQEGTYKKVGSNTWQKSGFRLICATNKDLVKEVENGRFRQDLYFRIADCELRVPSLRDRPEDIPFLVDSFLGSLFPGPQCPRMDKLVMDYLTARPYPGNVRELRQLVQRIALKHVDHDTITIGEIPLCDRASMARASANGFGTGANHFLPSGQAPDGIRTLIRNALLTGENWWNLKDRISETAIQVALDLEGNNKQKAAERLGVDVRTVQQYTKKKELTSSSPGNT
jgi:transcriptional regulator with GAF, ATPase, and Fis domain